MRDALLVVHGVPGDSDVGSRFESVVIDGIGSARAREASAFLLHEVASGNALMALRAIRGHRLPSIYLKPVVLVVEGREDTGYLSRAVDGVWDIVMNPEMPPGLADTTQKYRHRADEMEVTGPEGDSQLSFRILRFMAAREGTYVPETTIHSASGFSYPPLDPFVGSDAAGADVGELLASLEQQRVVEGSFATKAYACTHCGCGFLNFLEVCADCGSANLSVDDMVHHFRCGYVAPLRDFDRAGSLVCPKCTRTMRHVGVDYDKPSLVYDCNECHARFTEPNITTSCYRCRRVTPPETQVHRVVKSYQVSPFGFNAATHGLDSMFINVLQQKVAVIDYSVFRQIVFAETHRIERYQRSESALILLNFRNYESVVTKLGSRRNELFEEVASAFKTVLRPSDLVAVRNESLFLVLAPETGPPGAERSVERLSEAIVRLFEMAVDQVPELLSTIRPVGPGLDVDALLAETMAELGDGRGPDRD